MLDIVIKKMLFVPSDAMSIFISEIGRNQSDDAEFSEEVDPCITQGGREANGAAASTDLSNAGKDCSYNFDHLLITFMYDFCG